MEPMQLVLIVSLSCVSLIIVIAGIWLIMIFAELKNTLSRVNRLLDDAQKITHSVAGPINSISEFLMGFKNGFAILNKFMGKKEPPK